MVADGIHQYYPGQPSGQFHHLHPKQQVQALTKERKRLYRSEPDSVRIGQINEELKPLRKDIRICIRIEQQSKKE